MRGGYSEAIERINEIRSLKYIYKENYDRMRQNESFRAEIIGRERSYDDPSINNKLCAIKNSIIKLSNDMEVPVKHIRPYNDTVDYMGSLDNFENVAIDQAKAAREFEYQRRMRKFCTSIKTILNDEYLDRRALRVEELETNMYPDIEYKGLVEEYHKKYNLPIFIGDFLPQDIISYDIYTGLSEDYTFDMIDKDRIQDMLDDLRDFAPNAYSMGSPYGFNVRDDAYQLKEFLDSYNMLENIIQ